MIFILLMVVGIVFFIVIRNSKKNKEPDKRLKSINPKTVEKRSIVEKIIDTYSNKINLQEDSQFIKPTVMVEKCIRAGIRDALEHKKWIIFRFLGIIVGVILGPFLANFLLNIQDFFLLIVVGVGSAVLGFFYPVIRLDSMINDRKIAIDVAFPDFVDLTLVCVEAGMSSEQTYARIIEDLKRFSPILADEIGLLLTEITYFLAPKTAYDNFYFRTNNDFVKAFCGVVLQSLQYGTPLAQGLRSLSFEIREAQMATIERKAASLPSKLTVPMMLFTLPVLFTVILYPAINQAMKAF